MQTYNTRHMNRFDIKPSHIYTRVYTVCGCKTKFQQFSTSSIYFFVLFKPCAERMRPYVRA